MALATVAGGLAEKILLSVSEDATTNARDSSIIIFQEGENRGTSSSFSTLLSTLIPLLIVAIPLVLAFLFLRTKQPRIYAPRTFLDTLYEEEKTPKPAFGMFNWISAFRRLSDEDALNHQSLDSYLFVRFFKMITLICLVGTCMTWITLLPVNSQGGGGQSELSRLTISNVKSPGTLYWHAVVACLFLIFAMYIITRETIYYINLRQAYLMSPRNATRISTRTVLYTALPKNYRDERWFRGDFDHVSRVWVASDTKELENLVSQRDTTAYGLEDAEIELSTIATKKLLKGEKHSSADESAPRGMVASQWVSSNERPTQKKFPVLGGKVDTITTNRFQLRTLIPQVKQLQEFHRNGHGDALPAAFVQFESQRAAQTAFQQPFWRQPGNMAPSCIGVVPDQILWKNLRISKVEKLIRSIIGNTLIILLILFWSVPVGLVGALTDIDSLAKSIPFLSFVKDLPPSVLGVITGLLPTLLISILLALVPMICRGLASFSGCVTQSQVELKTQTWYFAFQVVQVFLITTFSSGAASIAKQIIDDPTQAPTLLAQNLPSASNFYLSFFILQGIAVAASTIFQAVPFLMFNVVGRFLDTTPRKKFERWIALEGLSWGDVYPKFTNLAIIAIAYSCIAPLVLGFAAIGVFLLYLGYRYCVFYTLTTTVDTKGDTYGLAMQQLSVGIYLSELCLIGLFSANGARGPITLMVVLFALTIVYQTYLNLVLIPLSNTLSDDLMAEDEAEALGHDDAEDGGVQAEAPKISDASTVADQGILGKIFAHYKSGGIFEPFLFHGSRSSYHELRRKLRKEFPGKALPPLPEKAAQDAYFQPAITSLTPKLWIVRDEIGISRQEVVGSSKVIEITDEGANFDEKGKVCWDQDNLRDAPIWKERVEY